MFALNVRIECLRSITVRFMLESCSNKLKQIKIASSAKERKKLFEDKLQTMKQISSTKNLECLQAQLLQHLRALVRRPHAALPQLF